MHLERQFSRRVLTLLLAVLAMPVLVGRGDPGQLYAGQVVPGLAARALNHGVAGKGLLA